MKWKFNRKIQSKINESIREKIFESSFSIVLRKKVGREIVWSYNEGRGRKKGRIYRWVHDRSGGKSSASTLATVQKHREIGFCCCKSCKTRPDSVHVCTCSHTRVRTRAYGEIGHDRRRTRVACPACNYRPWLNNPVILLP